MEIQTQSIHRLDHRRRRRAALLALLLGLSLLTVGAGAFSLAVFTASDTSTGSFTTGNIDLLASPEAFFSVSGILPGASGSQTVNVSNSGNIELRYAFSTTATNADLKGLRGQLVLTVTSGACPAAGTQLYTGALGSAGFGSAAQGPHAGDRVLASGTNEDLCFEWSLPGTTGDGFQDAATTATFTFAGEQTANNP